jgi:hypothetical protein
VLIAEDRREAIEKQKLREQTAAAVSAIAQAANGKQKPT